MKICLGIVIIRFLTFGYSQPWQNTGIGSYGKRYAKPLPPYCTYSHKQLNHVLVAAQSYYKPFYNTYGKSSLAN